MESIANESKTFPASRLVANMAIITGAGWTAFIFLGMTLTYVVERLPDGTGFDAQGLFEFGNRFTIAITVLTPIGVPGLTCLWLGDRLQNHISIKTVRAAVAALTFMAIVMIGAVLSFATSTQVFIRLSADPLFFINTLTATLPLYVLLCRQILKHDRIPISGYRDILSKPILVLCAALIAGFAVPLNMLLLRDIPISNLPQAIMLLFLPPILAGWIFYRFLVRWLGHNSLHSAAIPPVS